MGVVVGMANRLITATCVLLLIVVVGVWRWSYVSPWTFNRAAGRSEMRDGDSVGLINGGVWYFRHRARPLDFPVVAAGSELSAVWTVNPVDGNWEAGLGVEKTGPIRLGVAYHVRTVEHPVWYNDPRTRETRTGHMEIEERAARAPLAGFAELLALWPLGQVARAVVWRARGGGRRRAGELRRSDPPLLRAGAAWLFGFAAFVSALLLGVAVRQSFDAPRFQKRLWAVTTLPDGRAADVHGDGFEGSVIVNADGWELSRAYASDSPHRVPAGAQFFAAFRIERVGLNNAVPALAGYGAWLRGRLVRPSRRHAADGCGAVRVRISAARRQRPAASDGAGDPDPALGCVPGDGGFAGGVAGAAAGAGGSGAAVARGVVSSVRV